APRELRLLPFRRPVDALDRVARGEQTVALAEMVRKRVFDRPESVEHEVDDALDLPARDARRRRIDGNGRIRVCLRIDGALVVEQLIVRMGELLGAAILADLAREDAAPPGPQVL